MTRRRRDFCLQFGQKLPFYASPLIKTIAGWQRDPRKAPLIRYCHLTIVRISAVQDTSIPTGFSLLLQSRNAVLLHSKEISPQEQRDGSHNGSRCSGIATRRLLSSKRESPPVAPSLANQKRPGRVLRGDRAALFFLPAGLLLPLPERLECWRYVWTMRCPCRGDCETASSFLPLELSGCTSVFLVRPSLFSARVCLCVCMLDCSSFTPTETFYKSELTIMPTEVDSHV